MTFRKLLGCASAVLLAGTATPTLATPIDLGASVTFQERGTQQDNLPDIFTIENLSTGGARIAEIVIDLSTTSVGSTFFDLAAGGPGGGLGDGAFGLTPGASGAASTGYTGALGDVDGAAVITLLFADFDAGESITIGTDIDHDDGTTGDWRLNAAEFEGAMVSVTFVGGFTSTTLLGTFLDNPGPPPGDATALVAGQVMAVAEPPVPALLMLGLLAAAAARRRANRGQQ